jgi:hypothetical protein
MHQQQLQAGRCEGAGAEEPEVPACTRRKQVMTSPDASCHAGLPCAYADKVVNATWHTCTTEHAPPRGAHFQPQRAEHTAAHRTLLLRPQPCKTSSHDINASTKWKCRRVCHCPEHTHSRLAHDVTSVERKAPAMVQPALHIGCEGLQHVRPCSHPLNCVCLPAECSCVCMLVLCSCCFQDAVTVFGVQRARALFAVCNLALVAGASCLHSM